MSYANRFNKLYTVNKTNMGALWDKMMGHKKLLIFSALGVGAAVGGYKYYKQRQRFDEDQLFFDQMVMKNNSSGVHKQNGNSTNLSSSLQDDHEHDWVNKSTYSAQTKSGKIDQIISQIKVAYIPQSDYLDPSTIVQILQLSVELASDEYVAATLKNRVDRRRAKRTNRLHIYEKLILNYNEEIETILERAQAEILYRLDIHKDTFEESLLILMDRGYFQQLFMLQASVKQKIKEKIPSRKHLTRNQLKEVISYNITILKQKSGVFWQVISRLQADPDSQQFVPMAINLLVQDYIFEKYGVEEEDQIKNLQMEDNISDIEILQLLGQIEQCMQEFVGEMGFGGVDNIPDNLDA